MRATEVHLYGGEADGTVIMVQDPHSPIQVPVPTPVAWLYETAPGQEMPAYETVSYRTVKHDGAWYGVYGTPVQLGQRVYVPEDPHLTPAAIGQTTADLLIIHNAIPETLRVRREKDQWGVSYVFTAIGYES
jgi:hypothetical protein